MSQTSSNAARRGSTPRSSLQSTPLAEALARLREVASADASGAQQQLWDWLAQLGRKRDAKSLEGLFELGTPPQGLDGATDGMAVTALTNPLVDFPLQLGMGLWMPWRGKIFYADRSSGINRLAGSAVLPVKAIWPLYRLQRGPDGPLAFQFATDVESGKVEPRVAVLKIDYQPVRRNPTVIRRIRDELVELLPDTYLGRILFRLPAGRYTNIGYFALRQPAAGYDAS